MDRGSGDGEEMGAEASGMESGARLGHPHSWVQLWLYHALALLHKQFVSPPLLEPQFIPL